MKPIRDCVVEKKEQVKDWWKAREPTGFSVTDISTLFWDIFRVIQTRSNSAPAWISSVNLNISKYKLLQNCQLKSATTNLSDVSSSFVCWNKNRGVYLFCLLQNDRHLPIQNYLACFSSLSSRLISDPSLFLSYSFIPLINVPELRIFCKMWSDQCEV